MNGNFVSDYSQIIQFGLIFYLPLYYQVVKVSRIRNRCRGGLTNRNIGLLTHRLRSRNPSCDARLWPLHGHCGHYHLQEWPLSPRRTARLGHSRPWLRPSRASRRKHNCPSMDLHYSRFRTWRWYLVHSVGDRFAIACGARAHRHRSSIDAIRKSNRE